MIGNNHIDSLYWEWSSYLLSKQWNQTLRQISIKLFYLYQRLQCTDNCFFKIKFVLFLYLLGVSILQLLIIYRIYDYDMLTLWQEFFVTPFVTKYGILIRMFRIMSILIMFCLFRVMTSEMLGRLLSVFTLFLSQRQHIIVVDAVDYK
jgi:hypothetical protein